MHKNIYIIAFLLFGCVFRFFSQAPPTCPSISPGINGGANTATIVCAGGCVPLTSTVVAVNQTTSYSVASIPYAPFPYSGGTGVSVGTDDVWSPVVNLPFNFCYYGTQYSQCLVGSNGEISFNLTNASGYDNWSISTALPNIVNLPGNTICGVFRDIDPYLGGSVYYYITGTSPCRALVVCFDSVPLFDNSCGTCTCGGTPYSKFQMVLYETSNFIDIFVDNSFSCSTWNSGYGIIGVQDPTGTIATVAPGWNVPSTPTGNFVAFRFTPTGAPLYTVNWTGPNGFTANTATATACPLVNSTYTVTLNVTSCTGMTLTLQDTVRVTVTPGATLAVNSPTICSGGSVALNVSGGTTYSWTPATGLSATTGATVNANPTVTTVYTVYDNSGGPGCVPIATSTVTVLPAVVVTVNSPPGICSGNNTTLNAGGATNYTWSPGTGLSSTSNPTVTASPTVTSIYTVTGTSAGCPPSSATTVVNVTQSYTISVPSATICPSSSATLTASGDGSGVYNWNPGTNLNTTLGPVVVANPASLTTYTVSGGICVTPGTCSVTVVPNCTIAVNSPTICINQSVVLNVTPGAISYLWSPAIGLSATTGSTVIASPLATTVYTVLANFGGPQPSETTCTVTVNPLPVLTVNNATECQGLGAPLTVTGGNIYAWYPFSGLSSGTAATVIASPAVTTTYTVFGTSIYGCKDSVFAVVTVNPSPVATVVPNNPSGCSPVCITYSLNTASLLQNCFWDFGNGGSPVNGNCTPNNCFKVKGTYYITVTLTDLNGCIGRSTATVTVYPDPLADFLATPQPTSILESDIQFYDQTSGATPDYWRWNFGDLTAASDTSSKRNPKHFYKDTGTYMVTLFVKTANNCVDSTLKFIRIDDDYELFVPNAFTPNGDGINEVFLPKMAGVEPAGYKMVIFDRWGNQIFYTENIEKGWDGSINGNGQILQQDVYVWKINLKTTQGITRQALGHVSLVK